MPASLLERINVTLDSAAGPTRKVSGRGNGRTSPYVSHRPVPLLAIWTADSRPRSLATHLEIRTGNGRMICSTSTTVFRHGWEVGQYMRSV
jgi:hypothetical protein